MKGVNIQNVRMGFNTSSSSQHSAVININPDYKAVREKSLYGWNTFVLKSKEDKRHYFATMLYSNLCSSLPSSYASVVTNSLLGGNYIDDSDPPVFDHRSLLLLPINVRDRHWYDGDKPIIYEIDKEFFLDMVSYFADNDDIAICGGNTDSIRPDYGKEDPTFNQLTDYMADCYGQITARKDGNFWVLFNRKNGTKVRLSFRSQEDYTHSSLPESVDIKITDFCPFGCDDCYQNSTLRGKFASPDHMSAIAAVLSRMNVMEVALGGGEPTFHPFLGEIIENFHRHNICVNLTTANSDWVESNKTLSEKIVELASGIAFSVGDNNHGSTWDFQKLGNWLAEKHFSGEYSAHMVLGESNTDTTVYNMSSIARTSSRVTLLGWKSTGRARKEAPHKVDLKKIFAKARDMGLTVGMDSKAVSDYSQELEEANIPNILVVPGEGKFSLYIDAVKHIVAPDSYSPDTSYIPFGCNAHIRNYLEKVITKNFPFT